MNVSLIRIRLQSATQVFGFLDKGLSISNQVESNLLQNFILIRTIKRTNIF